MARWIMMLIILLLIFPLSAQEDEGNDDVLVVSGCYNSAVVDGRLNNLTPSVSYQVEGLAGDYISLELRRLNGDLDPILTVLDPQNNVLRISDDTRGTVDAMAEDVFIRERGVYTIVVARFGYGLGTTAGDYELEIARSGNSSESGSNVCYGDTVASTIRDDEDELFYTFIASQGDIIDVTMRQRSGDLDPYLRVVQVVNGQPVVLEESDDVPGLGLDARIEGFVIPTDGTYIIIASRYGVDIGTSTGGFTLSLDEATNSGLGNSAQAAVPIRIGARVEGLLTINQWRRFYRFEAQQDDIVTIRMTRPDCTGGCLDSYVSLLNAGLNELAFNDDANEDTQNALIEGFRIPANGTYYIMASRYLLEDGLTTGSYVLELDDLGNAFDGVPEGVLRMNYGISTTGTIDEITPEVVYAFFGIEGETITISMNRSVGDLDPFLVLQDAEFTTLVRNDDNGIDQNAGISSFTLPTTGIYYIRATRFNGDPLTTGSYTLVLARRVDGGESSP